MAVKKVALLSPGDMGHVVARVLRNHGMTVLTCLEGRSDRTRGLAREAGVEVAPSYPDLVRQADLIVSILVPDQAIFAAQKVAAAVEPGTSFLYADCNAISPATALAIERIVAERGGRFIDGGIIGPPPRKPKTTRFYVSGPAAGELETLQSFGLDVRVVGDRVGQASGLKMTYAALTKGFGALATALLVAAQRMGLYEDLAAEFQLSQSARYDWMEEWLPSIPPKAERWVGEMEEIAKTLEEQGLTPLIHQGAVDVYRFIGQSPLAEETPETRDQSRTLARVIEILAG